MSGLSLKLPSIERNRFVDRGVYMPIVPLVEYAKENAIRWKDGNRTARLLYPNGSNYFPAAAENSTYTSLVSGLTGMTNNLPAKNDNLAAAAVRKYVSPAFFKKQALMSLKLTRAVLTGTVETVGQLYDNWIFTSDTTILCVYALSSTDVRVGFLTRSGDNWVLTASETLFTSSSSQTNQNLRLYEVAAGKYAVTYVESSNGRMCAFTTSGSDATPGTPFTVGQGSVLPGATKLSDNTLFVVTYQASTSKNSCRIVTFSGLTETVNSFQDTTYNNSGNWQFHAVMLSSTKVLVLQIPSVSGQITMAHATVSGTSISYGTWANIVDQATTRERSIIKQNASGVWIVCSDGVVYPVVTSGATPSNSVTINAGANYNNLAYDGTNNEMYIDGFVYNTSAFTSFTQTRPTIDVAGFGVVSSTGELIVSTSSGMSYDFQGAQVTVTVRAPDGGTDETPIVVNFGSDLVKDINVDSDFYRTLYFDVENTSSKTLSLTVSQIIAETA